MKGTLTPATTASIEIRSEEPTIIPMACETLRPRASRVEPAVHDAVLHPITRYQLVFNKNK